GSIALAHIPYDSLFHNFQPYYYWSGTPVPGKTDSHESFSFGSGYRSDNTHSNFMYVIPVYDGHVQMVTSNADDGPGSLRAAVMAAQPGATIEFSADLNQSEIILLTAIPLSKPLYIVGPGADKLTISGDNGTGPARLFDIVPGVPETTIAFLTLEKGQA